MHPHENGSTPFHLQGGWVFWRNPDGSVVIEHRVYGNKINELSEQMYTIDAKDAINPDSWASIVAHVSVFGDTREVWTKARDLHNGTNEFANLEQETH